jgi:hypothetical protein
MSTGARAQRSASDTRNARRRRRALADHRLRDAIARVAEVAKTDADLNTELKLGIPLIPLLRDKKVNLDLGDGLDLRQWWEKATGRLGSWWC